MRHLEIRTRERFDFLLACLEDAEHVGAILPSSRFLAREVAHSLRFVSQRPCRVLEVGPGTGPVTGEVLGRLGAGDRLTVYELNRRFCRILEERFPAGQQNAELTIVNAPIQQLPTAERFDHIIMGIPVNNLAPPMLSELLHRLIHALTDDGVFVFYEYARIPGLQESWFHGVKRQRWQRTRRVLERILKRHEFKSERVMMNVPPLHVHYLQKRHASAS